MVALVRGTQDLRRPARRLAVHGKPTALDVEIKFAAWAEGILSPLNNEQIQKMLATEFGGMNEVMADLYAERATRAGWRGREISSRCIVDRLAEKKDILPGIHGNTQVPKIYGALKVYLYTGNETEGTAAKYFWDEVTQHHSFATGGKRATSTSDSRTSCRIWSMAARPKPATSTT